MSQRPTVRHGDRGEAVTELQKKLVEHGEDPGPVDGVFGDQTRVALEAFQMSHNLAFDGVAGAKTWAALHGE